MKRTVSAIILTLLLGTLLFAPILQRAKAPSYTEGSNTLVNGDFETGTLDGWAVKGICSISNTTVHSGSYSAYVSDYTGAPNCDDWLRQDVSASHLTVDSGITLRVWVYPLEVGPVQGQYPMSRIELWFMNESSGTWPFCLRYTWCNSEEFNTTQAVNFEFFNWNVSEWNFLDRNVTADVYSYFGNVDFSNITLHYVDATYHYSSYSPGAFYVDDILLTKSTIVVPDDFPTIQEAINAANNGDTIFVRNGVYYEHNIVVNKTLEICGESSSGTVLDSMFNSYAFIVASDNVAISDLTLNNSGIGVYSSGVANLQITGNLFTGYSTGISLWNCTGAVIRANTFGRLNDAVECFYSLDGRIEDNIMDFTSRPAFSYETFGIYLRWSDNFTVRNNTVMNCNWEGLDIMSSSNCTFCSNDLVNNTNSIYFTDVCSQNVFYHNNFINNGPVVGNSTSIWDNGCEGNYWSDYNGTVFDTNGIGAAPYVIDVNNTDNYPLMNVYWNLCDINHDLKIDMRDLSISAKAFMTVAGDPLWNPHADITGPIGLPDGKVDMRDIGLIARHFMEPYH